jgi:hypothetical protein
MFLLLAAGAAGGAYIYSLWKRSDELLQARVLSFLEEVAPEWKTELGRARFDFQGRVRLHDFKLHWGPGDVPLANFPEMILVMDREQMAQQKVLLHQVRFLRPQLLLVHKADGTWNWSGLPPPRRMSDVLPELRIEQGTLTVRIENAAGGAGSTVVFREVSLQFVPSGKQRYAVTGTTAVDRAGVMQFDAQWDLETRSWSLNGGIQQLKIGSDLIGLITDVSPEIRENLDRTLGRIKNPAAPAASPDLGLELTADVGFRVSQWRPDAEHEYRIGLQVTTGQITNPRLPFALYDVQAALECTNRQCLVRKLIARNGVTQVALDAKIERQPNATPARVALAVRDLSLDGRLYERLPETLREIYRLVQPAGRIDVQTTLDYDGTAGWKHATDVTAKDCTATCVKFPYQVDGIVGTIQHRGQTCKVSMKGWAGKRPVTLTGNTLAVGSPAAATFDIAVDDLPLDERFLAATSPGVQTALRNLNIQGTGDIRFRVSRPAGGGPEFQPTLVGRLRNCTMACTAFPYSLTNLNGGITWSGDTWTFRDLQAAHGAAQLTGGGTFVMHEKAGVLDLTVTTTGGLLDQSLQMALPKPQQKLWDEFAPRGQFNAETRLVWTPGELPQVDINAQLSNAGFELKAFPYPLDEVNGALSLTNHTLTIRSLSGRHDDTKVRVETGWGEVGPTGEWRVRLEKLEVDDLDPNRRFRRALPNGFREVVENLDPRDGTISLVGMLEFRGTGDPRDDITSAWHIETVYSGATLTAGVDLHNVYGRVFSRGTWNGKAVNSKGHVEFDSLTLDGYQFTEMKGPVEIKGSQLVIGSREAVTVAGPSGGALRISADDRITAKAIDGVFTLDGIAVLEKVPSYHVLITLSNARLERFAQLYLPGHNKLQGVMNGWVELNGRGSSSDQIEGRGQLQISPAALYELPVILSIFQILKFVPPDTAAFNQAFVYFNVARSQFDLRQIDLVGNAISLRGRGVVRFDGKLALNFYSTVGRNQLQLPLPLVQGLLGEAASGWVGVEVRGSMKDPLAKLTPVPKLDEALKNFLGAFEPRPMTQPFRPAQAAPARVRK